MIRREFIKKGLTAGAFMAPASYVPFGNWSADQQHEDSNTDESTAETVLWQELTWPEIGKLAEEDAMVIIPVGSIEQHGPHLPVSMDYMATSEVSRRVAERMTRSGHPAVVLPGVWTGVSPHHMLFPGTITLNYEQFATVLKQICFCVKEHGFSRIVFVNGHGGNVNPLRVLMMEINEMLGRPAFVTSYWDVAREDLRGILEVDSGIGHSAEAETSIMLAMRPDLVRRPFDESIGPDRPDPSDLREGVVYTFRTYRDRTSIGVIGNAGSATREKGEKILETVTHKLAEFLARESLWEITL